MMVCEGDFAGNTGTDSALNDRVHAIAMKRSSGEASTSSSIKVQSQVRRWALHQMMAMSALMTLPIIVLFFFTQKQFIQGVKMSGVKG